MPRGGGDPRVLLAWSQASGEEATHVLEKSSIDLILLDLRMPGSNGIDLLTKIKRRHPEIAVVIMTGYASITSRGAGDEIGCLRLH